MLDNLVTPIVAVAVILAITFPIWFLILLARLVHHIGDIAQRLEAAHVSWLHHVQLPLEGKVRAVSNSAFGR